MEFELNNDRPSIIKVIGVGGGGSNAVNHMFRQGIHGVDFMICNTDVQALDMSPVKTKIQLGPELTEGLGAGSLPDKGREAAMENINDVKSQLQANTKMVFITAGMGGGTGTGAAPVIANIAKGLGILTVGIVTLPFTWEGKKRKQQALDGLKELQQNVDTLLVISNDKLREIYGDLKLTNAYSKADDILTVAARSIAEIITVTGYVNVDFADVKTVLKDSGVAIMGRATAEGNDRARLAAELAMDSPLLNDSNITGARHILLNITSGSDEISMDEVSEITDYIQQKAGATADIIFGTGHDESLGEKVCITIIATGFKTADRLEQERASTVEVLKLNTDVEPKQETPAFTPPAVTNAGGIFIKGDVQEIAEVPPTPLVEETPLMEKEEEIIVHSLSDEPEPIEEYIEPNMVVTDVENTFTFNFDVNTFHNEEVPEPEVAPEMYTDNVYTTDFKMEEKTVEAKIPEPTPEPESADRFSRTKERIMKLRELTFKMNGNQSLNEMDQVPAYERKNVDMLNTPNSKDSSMSRYTVGPDNNGTRLSENNTFLNDKVD